jgi:outer membrane protein assembly factor BamB
MSFHRRAFPAWIVQVILIFAATGNAAESFAADSSYFRLDAGISRAGGALPENFDAPEALVWRMPLDGGHSTPILHSGKIFLTTYQSGSKQLATVALVEKTGQVAWRAPFVPERVEQTHPIGSPATATVACDGERVFAFFGSAGLFCYDLDGQKLWEQRLGPFRDEYGAGSSPILYDGKIILNQDHDIDSFLIALDCKTGRVVWKICRPDAVRSYSTPIIWFQNGQPELLVAGALQLTAYNPVNGERLWWVNGLARIVIPTPVDSGPMIYMASWSPGGDLSKRLELDAWATALAKWDHNHDGKLSRNEIEDREVLERFNRMDLDQDGMLSQQEWERHAVFFRRAQNAVLALRPSGRGELSEDVVVWKHNRGVPYVATPLLDQGILWMVKEGGIVTKLDATSGKLLQEERVPGVGNYFASPVVGDGKVYFASESGTVSVLSAEKDWRLVSSHNFHEKIYATPAFGRGRLYLRTEQALYCFQGARPRKE